MLQWLDGTLEMSKGLDYFGREVANIVQSTVSILWDPNQPPPKAGDVVDCRVVVAIGNPVLAASVTTCGIFPSVEFELSQTPPHCILRIPERNEEYDVTQQPEYHCGIPGGALPNGANSLGVRALPSRTMFFFGFRIQMLSSNNSGNVSCYVETEFGSMYPQISWTGTMQQTGQPGMEMPSKDGYIVYTRDPGPTSSIEVIGFDGAPPASLLSEGYSGDAAWSTFNDLVAFASYRDGRAQPYLMSADGTNQRRLTPSGPLSQMTCGTPRWISPNELCLHAIEKDGKHWQIWTLNPDGSGQLRVSPDDADYLYPVLLRFTRLLACIRNKKFDVPPFRVWSIVVQNLDYPEGSWSEIYFDATFRRTDLATRPEVTDSMVYASTPVLGTGPSQIRCAKLERGIKWVEQILSEGENPTISPDGKWVAYTRNRSLYKVRIDGGGETLLFGDFSTGTSIDWSSPWFRRR